MNKRKFLTTGILGAIIGFFVPKTIGETKIIKNDIPTLLDGELVLNKSSIQKIGKNSIDTKQLSELINKQVTQILLRESRPHGLLDTHYRAK